MSDSPQVVKIDGGTFEEANHRYVDDKGIERPSVTQIADACGLVNLDNVPGDTLERKRQIGDSVHYATRLFDQDDLDPFSVHEETADYLESYQNIVDELGIVSDPAWIERGFIHTVNGMVYSGTVDRVCRFTKSSTFRDYLVVLELKCAYSEEPSWKVQLAGYECPVRSHFPNEKIVRVACQLRPRKKDTNERQKAKLFMYQNPRDIDIFKICLSLVNWRINEGLPWKRERL